MIRASAGLATGRAIKEQFDSDMDVTIWNEGVFKRNTDAGIVVARGQLQFKPRGELLALFFQLFRHNAA